MQLVLFAPQKSGRRKLDKIFSHLPPSMLGTAMKGDQSVHPWWARVVSELCSQAITLGRNWQNKAEQSPSHEHAIQSCQHAYIVSFSCIVLFSRGEHYASSVSPHINILAAITKQEISLKQWASVLHTGSSRSGVINTLSNSPVFVKIFRQTTSNVSSNRKRTACDIFFQALNYRQFLSSYNPFRPQYLDNNRQEFQAAKEKCLSINTDSTYNLS